MKRFILSSMAAVLGGMFLSFSTAPAQNVYPPGPPAYGPGFQTPLSPYLNLLRGGMTAANYYVGTVPEFQRRQDARVLQGQINTALNYSGQALLNQLSPEEQARLRPVRSAGHMAFFGNTGPYFSGGGGLAGGMGGMGGGGSARPPMTQPPQQGRQGPLGAMPPRNPMTGVGVGGR